MAETMQPVSLAGSVLSRSYDLSRLGAEVVMDINPFYVPPDEMLHELQERAGRRTVV